MRAHVRAGLALLVLSALVVGAGGCGRHKGGLHGDFCSKLRVYARDYPLRVKNTDLAGMGTASRVYTDLAAAAPADIAPVVDLLDHAYRAFLDAGFEMTARHRATERYPAARLDAAFVRLATYGREVCHAELRG